MSKIVSRTVIHIKAESKLEISATRSEKRQCYKTIEESCHGSTGAEDAQ